MNTLEERLATGLRAAFDAVPEGEGNLAAVKRSGRRRSLVQRGSLAAAAAAAAVTLVAVGSVALLRPISSDSESAITAVAAEATTVTTSAAGQTTTTEAGAEETVTTVGAVGIGPASIPVTLSEYELDLATVRQILFEDPRELQPRTTTAIPEPLLVEVQSAAAQILTDVSATAPYSATLVQHMGDEQLVLVEFGDGSCLTVIEHPRQRDLGADPRACTPGEPLVWEIAGENVVVWWDLPETAALVGATADCGSAAVCVPESAPVLEGIAAWPTTYQGVPLQLTAYDDEGVELATATVDIPKYIAPEEEGRVITLDGQMLHVMMPAGMAFNDLSMERHGQIRNTETRKVYPYEAWSRIDPAIAHLLIAPGEVKVGTKDLGTGRQMRTVSIGLERGTVIVTVPNAEEEIDPDAWAGAFVDMVGDGEQTLVIEAGPGHELVLNRGDERRGTWTTLYGDEGGVVVLSTGGCIFDHITPSSDLVSTPSEHERVGTMTRVPAGSAVWCVDDITVSVTGSDAFIDAMLAELEITP